MKLSQYQQDIERAYQTLLHEAHIRHQRPAYSFNLIHRRPNHVLPRNQQYPTIPLPPTSFPPQSEITPFQAREKFVQLATFQATYHDSVTPMTPDMAPLILDTGASISISPYPTDFITPIRPVQHVNIKGIASGLAAKGIGDLSYSFVNDAGTTQTIVLKNCLYVPQCVVRLICPRQIGAVTGNPEDGFYATNSKSTLIVHGQPTTVKYDTLSQLPMLFTKPGIQSYLSYSQCHPVRPVVATASASSGNLTKRQRQKLYLHEICAHEGFQNLNSWIRKGYFPQVDPTLALEPDPMCMACAFGKARRISHKTHIGHITQGHTAPGQGDSSDGLESGSPGRPFTSKGSPSKLRHNYVSFWVDHASSFVYITFHSSKAATELVQSKTEFEQFAARFNIKIQNIRADNGVYSANLFRESCLKQQQNLTFCTVGAHWQNGVAERFIGTITQRARTILLHAMAKWPSVVMEDMWTFALRHAVNFHNYSVRKQQTKSTYELFTNQIPTWSLPDFRVFGAPTYVLHKALQDGNSHGKWKSRAWLGVYIGNSNCHSSAIPLVYNPQTTHVTPQYHVVYDEYFLTVQASPTLDPEAYLDKLYDTTARWLHKDAFTDDPHYFENFWDPSSPSPNSRKRHAPDPSQLPFRGSTTLPLRGSTQHPSRGSSTTEVISPAQDNPSAPARTTFPTRQEPLPDPVQAEPASSLLHTPATLLAIPDTPQSQCDQRLVPSASLQPNDTPTTLSGEPTASIDASHNHM